jgi:hypothetical protein
VGDRESGVRNRPGPEAVGKAGENGADERRIRVVVEQGTKLGNTDGSDDAKKVRMRREGGYGCGSELGGWGLGERVIVDGGDGSRAGRVTRGVPGESSKEAGNRSIHCDRVCRNLRRNLVSCTGGRRAHICTGTQWTGMTRC